MSRGILYIIATPIGNLEDITYRAVRLLSEVDVIYAEDTQVSRKLLQNYSIQTQLVSCNAKNEESRINEIKGKLDLGQSLAIISDAGTPGISDPSVRVVSALRNEDYEISPIPGPSAVITALSAAGIPTNQFYFHGFLPNKKGRQTQLKELKEISCTIVLYESVYRIKKTCTQIYEVMGNRYVVVCRELTKKFESFYSGHLDEILDNLDDIKEKGEFVLLIAAENFKK